MSRTDNMEGAGSFDTVQYCIDNSVPCFTFRMDSSKRVCVKGGGDIEFKKATNIYY